MIHNIQDSSVSFFARNTDVSKPYNGNIIDILTSHKLIEKYGKRIQRLRSVEYKSEEYEELKNGIKGRLPSLPLITPHGTFSYRDKAGLIKHSGLMSFDIDVGGNSWLNKHNAPLLRDKLGLINSVCYCAISAGGQGVWGVVPIQHPEKHEQYFLQLERDFLERFKIVVDKSCKDIPRARYWSYDKDAIIKATSEYYKPTFYTLPPAPPRPARQYTDQGTIAEAAAKYLIENRPSLECTYAFFLRVFFACRHAFGEAGKQVAIDILNACTTFAASNTAKNVDAVWKDTEKRPTDKAVTTGTLRYIAQQAGHEIPKKQAKPAQPTTPSRSSFVMPAPDYKKLDDTAPVHLMTTAEPPTAAPVHLMTTAEPPTAAPVHLMTTAEPPPAAPVHLMAAAEPPPAAKERQRLSGGDKVSEGTRAVVQISEQPLENPVKAPVHLMTTAEQVANPADQREALQLVGEYWQQNTDTAKAEDTEASEEKWNAGKRWAEQIRQRGTTANAVPFWQRQDARQHHQQNHIKNE